MMQMLEENNKKIVETISSPTFSSNTTPSHLQPVINTSTRPTPIQNENRENTSDASTLVLPIKIDATNTVNTNTLTTLTFVTSVRNHVTKNSQCRASSLVAQTTETHSFVTKGGQQSFLEEKKTSLSFFEFDLKLPLPVRVVAKPYLQDYTNPKYKSSNTSSSDTCKHVMKFVKTLGVDGLDDDLKLKEFSKSSIEKAYTSCVNLTPGSVES
ncbi:hypothetical protein Goarm_000460 [Gossypium armourianum]|uniref:Uncharacterized protein n=1 Tax=Gossypium armourianum TaxID=34283 RepID=A0A7J9KA01_9ROSI|nr:hypothetical protein [Gossypium armourianum]